jgi:hypothetical protein
MRDVSGPTALTGQAPTKAAKDMRPVDDQSDFLATDARGRAMSDRCITEPVELLRDAPDIYGSGITEPLDLEALAWSCGIDTKETCIPAAPAADHSACFAQDRAAVVTTKVLQIGRRVLTAWLHRERADMAGARAEIAALLRDEFHDVALTTMNEIRREDG